MTTILNQRGVRARMQCSPEMASAIEKTFLTAGQLVEAVESDEPLTEIDGIGPKTSETIEEWYENRHEIEENVDNAEVERTGAKTAMIYNLGDWSDAL